MPTRDELRDPVVAKAYFAANHQKRKARGWKQRVSTEQRKRNNAREAARYRNSAELKAQRKAALKAWKKANPGKVLANIRRRQAYKLKATPKWANFEAIAAIYEWAHDATELTGVFYNVDHIIPLRGKTVCGLHVENNLRVILAEDNRKKGNRLLEDLL